MASLAAPTGRPVTLEALPSRPERPPGPGSGAGGGPPDDDELMTGSWRLPARPAHLPRVLTGLRVLVVDDDEDTADLFASALAACGAAIVTATSAAAALRAFAAGAPDVVVSDIAMPVADGYWLVGEIRKLPEASASGVPVLAVTAFGREHSRARALAAGFVDYLEKPVEPESLCLAVARATGR